MFVRGWIMVGPPPCIYLPQQRFVNTPFHGIPPDASTFVPGDWIVWFPAPGQSPLVLVCVEIPL